MVKYRKRPVVIEAVQFLGDHQDPAIGGPGTEGRYDNETGRPYLLIKTLEGTMRADVGDWVITGVKGERYPCKPDIFAATYEAVAE